MNEKKKSCTEKNKKVLEGKFLVFITHLYCVKKLGCGLNLFSPNRCYSACVAICIIKLLIKLHLLVVADFVILFIIAFFPFVNGTD